MNATVEGQTTAHYLMDALAPIRREGHPRLAHGVPVGGELDYLDEGTLSTRRSGRGGGLTFFLRLVNQTKALTAARIKATARHCRSRNREVNDPIPSQAMPSATAGAES